MVGCDPLVYNFMILVPCPDNSLVPWDSESHSTFKSHYISSHFPRENIDVKHNQKGTRRTKKKWWKVATFVQCDTFEQLYQTLNDIEVSLFTFQKTHIISTPKFLVLIIATEIRNFLTKPIPS